MKEAIERLIHEYQEKQNLVRVKLETVEIDTNYLRKNNLYMVDKQLERIKLDAQLHAYRQAEADFDSLLGYIGE